MLVEVSFGEAWSRNGFDEARSRNGLVLLRRRGPLDVGVAGLTGVAVVAGGVGLKDVPTPVSSDGSASIRGPLMYSCAWRQLAKIRAKTDNAHPVLVGGRHFGTLLQ